MTPTLGHYLAVSGLLFIIGLAGVILRRNIIIIFMCLELMLNAANLSLVAFSRFNLNARRPAQLQRAGARIFCHHRCRGGGRGGAGHHRRAISRQADNPRRGSEQPEILMSAATVPWIILFAPLVSATLILFFGKYSRKLSAGLAIGAALLSSALSWWLFFQPGEVGPNQVFWINIPDVFDGPDRHDR